MVTARVQHGPKWASRVDVPHVHIWETEGAIIVAADVPGADATSVDVTGVVGRQGGSPVGFASSSWYEQYARFVERVRLRQRRRPRLLQRAPASPSCLLGRNLGLFAGELERKDAGQALNVIGDDHG
jgi:hypothetical protein